jgi:hypothetical protein
VYASSISFKSWCSFVGGAVWAVGRVAVPWSEEPEGFPENSPPPWKREGALDAVPDPDVPLPKVKGAGAVVVAENGDALGAVEPNNPVHGAAGVEPNRDGAGVEPQAGAEVPKLKDMSSAERLAAGRANVEK